MGKLYLTSIFVFLALFRLSAQIPSIELLEHNLKNSEGTERVKILGNLAEAYLETDNAKAVLYALRAIKQIEDEALSPNTLVSSNIYNTLGAAYFYEQDYSKALEYYETEFKILNNSSFAKDIAGAYHNLAIVSQKLKNYEKATEFLEKGLSIALEIKSPELQKQFYKARYLLFNEIGKSETALDNLAKYTALRDFEVDKTQTELNILRKTTSTPRNTKYRDTAHYADQTEMLKLENEFLKRQAELTKTKEELNRTKTQNNRATFVLGILIIGLLGSGGIVYYRAETKRRQAFEQLEIQADLLEHATELISEKNFQILENINYARRIQDSILIPEHEIRKHLPEAFVYYQPKEIVSGDFYWFSKQGDEYILAAIDCSGHGVPGAFMSLIGYTLLNEIVNEKHITKPDRVLKHLHVGVMAALHNAGSDTSDDDGMDMSLCTINTRLKRFQFAGAKNHLYVLQGDKLKVLKANHHTVGGRPMREDIKVEFTSYDFMYDENTSIYMLSDGYFDQFGGIEDTKFNSKRFKKLLIDNRERPMEEQKEIIRNTLMEWKGTREQVDDILVLGVKLDG